MTITSKSESEVYEAIGRFVVLFSQLEYAIRLALSRALKLRGGEATRAVVGSYDFRVLCDVASVVLRKQSGITEAERIAIQTLFNDCLDLNIERVRIAHGMWWFSDLTDEFGAMHISRQTFRLSEYFRDVQELRNLSDRASSLMSKVIELIGPQPPGSRGLLDQSPE